MNLEFISHILVNIEYWSYLIIVGGCVIIGALALALLLLWVCTYLVNAILNKLKMIPFLFEFAKWKREQREKAGEQA
jgi:hypothetical protein